MGNLRVPYTRQFAPLRKLLLIIHQNEGDSSALKKAFASTFHKSKRSPEKTAGNALISLKVDGVIATGCEPTDFGKRLLDTESEKAAHELLAKRMLFDLDGILPVEPLREM